MWADFEVCGGRVRVSRTHPPAGVLHLEQRGRGDGGDAPEVHQAVGAPAQEELVVAAVVPDGPHPDGRDRTGACIKVRIIHQS